MNRSAEDSLLRVASSTFEDLAFLLPERGLTEAQREGTLDGAMSVEFSGTLRGRLEVRLYGEVLPVLAMNMLGEPHPPAEPLQRDALGELANVICGNLLPVLAGSREVFRLSAPRPASSGPAAPAASLALGVEGGRAEVLLFIDGGPPMEGGG